MRRQRRQQSKDDVYLIIETKAAGVCISVFKKQKNVNWQRRKRLTGDVWDEPDVWKLSDQNPHLHLDGGDVLQLDDLWDVRQGAVQPTGRRLLWDRWTDGGLLLSRFRAVESKDHFHLLTDQVFEEDFDLFAFVPEPAGHPPPHLHRRADDPASHDGPEVLHHHPPVDLRHQQLGGGHRSSSVSDWFLGPELKFGLNKKNKRD